MIRKIKFPFTVVLYYTVVLYFRVLSEDRVLSSGDAGHRNWQNVRKNNLQNMAKEPKKTHNNHRSIVSMFSQMSFQIPLQTFTQKGLMDIWMGTVEEMSGTHLYHVHSLTLFQVLFPE